MLTQKRFGRMPPKCRFSISFLNLRVLHSVWISLKELGGRMSKCLVSTSGLHFYRQKPVSAAEGV